MSKATPFDGIFDRLCHHLNETKRIDVISKDFVQLSDDLQRIQFLLNLKPVRELVQISSELIAAAAESKSSSKSIELRNAGNCLFKEKKYVEALSKYTQSLAYAPIVNTDDNFCNKNIESNHHTVKISLLTPENYECVPENVSTNENFSKLKNVKTGTNSITVTDCASFAYANRSAVLFHLKQYCLCLSDINAAITNNYPLKLQYKLLDRRARCYLALGDQPAAFKSFDATAASLQFSDLAEVKRKQFQKEIDKNISLCVNNESPNASLAAENQSCLNNSQHLASEVTTDITKSKFILPQFNEVPNSLFPSLSCVANVAYEEDRGRFIVATRDIVPGDIILIEQPYASVLLPERYYDHCRQCYSHTLAPVSCQYCPSALYCSTDCRLRDTLLHQRECRGGLLEIFRLSGVDKFAFLAVRSVMMKTLESLELARSDENGKNQRRVEMVRSDHSTNVEVYESHDYSAICGLVTNADKRSAHDLFRRGIIAVYLLRALQHVGFFQSGDKSSTKDDSLQMMEYVGGLLLSHLQSFPCNAHEISEFVLDPAAVATSEPRELGAGIYATLSLFNHSCDPVVTRSFYGSTCVVRAIRSVRAGDELSDNYGAVFAVQTREERRTKLTLQYYFECGCEACVSDWPLFDISQAPVWLCNSCNDSPLSADGVCTGCGHRQSVADKLEKLKLSHRQYTTAFELLLAGDASSALPTLLAHLRVMDSLCCRPWAEYCSCQEAVKQCFSILSNCCVISNSK